MKIEGNRPNFDTPATDRIDARRGVNPTAKDATSATDGNDQVRVSSDVQLANTAIQAATRASDVRPDVVERAKALLADGKIGADPQALADTLIDRALDSDS